MKSSTLVDGEIVRLESDLEGVKGSVYPTHNVEFLNPSDYPARLERMFREDYERDAEGLDTQHLVTNTGPPQLCDEESFSKLIKIIDNLVEKAIARSLACPEAPSEDIDGKAITNDLSIKSEAVLKKPLNSRENVSPIEEHSR